MEGSNKSSLMSDNDQLARMERFLTQFPAYLERLEKEGKRAGENLPKLTLEIEEFKKVQNDLTPALCEAVKKALKEEGKDFAQAVIKDLNSGLSAALTDYCDQAREIHQKYLEETTLFKKKMEECVGNLKSLLNLQKQRFTYRGVLLCMVFCLSSMLTGIGLYWFFPQNIYYADPNAARNIIMGRAVWDNMKHLSPKDQGLLLEGMKKYMLKK